MKYDRNYNMKKAKKSANRRVEPEHLKVPNFVQTPPSKRVVNQQRQRKVQENTRRHRKRRKRNYILYYILLLFLITIVGVSLSLTVFFNIENILVNGNVSIDTQSIINDSKILKGQNLFRINTKKATENIIKNNITIDSAEIKRKFPTSIMINVKMAETKAELKYKDKYYSLSYSNKIIGASKTPLDEKAIKVVGYDLKDVKLGDYIEDEEYTKLEVIDTVIDAINKNKLSQIKVIDITDEMTIKLYYANIYEIKAGGILEMEYKLKMAKSLIDNELADEKEKGIIDVSVDNGMYYFRHNDNIVVP